MPTAQPAAREPLVVRIILSSCTKSMTIHSSEQTTTILLKRWCRYKDARVPLKLSALGQTPGCQSVPDSHVTCLMPDLSCLLTCHVLNTTEDQVCSKLADMQSTCDRATQTTSPRILASTCPGKLPRNPAPLPSHCHYSRSGRLRSLEPYVEIVVI